MAKILKPGVIPAEYPVGETFRCGYCGCEWELEEGDTYRLPHTSIRDIAAYQAHCPQPGCREDGYLLIKDSTNAN